MTRRAKLSLDPEQRTKAAPPHGFDGEPDKQEPDAVPAPAPAAAAEGIAEAERVARHWQADRPTPCAEEGAVAAAPQHPLRAAGSTVVAVARVLARKPAVRAVGVAVLAGVSIYLLRRRLF
ncbi:hypothetical protein [Thiohalocapsa sp. ML1]|jgi:hypothetical protein|uniref:hypothetical protein n=1 Tax=Thiohalocapsa sp. ML1 TaxID=1431688 RepID=UPI0007323D48|nr:hypothetical protein [Thiohalocapsa sp. ML1]